jgi:hypothetical protein
MPFAIRHLLRLEKISEHYGIPPERMLELLIETTFENLPDEQRHLPKGWNKGDVGYRGP